MITQLLNLAKHVFFLTDIPRLEEWLAWNVQVAGK
jgi:hypothetical protein